MIVGVAHFANLNVMLIRTDACIVGAVSEALPYTVRVTLNPAAWHDLLFRFDDRW